MSSQSEIPDSAPAASQQQLREAPTVSQTGQGYRYVRCQRGDRDETVYIHQLCAIADGADPHLVFGDAHDTHHLPLSQAFDLDQHCPPLRWLNTPETVEPRARWEHRESHLQEGEAD